MELQGNPLHALCHRRIRFLSRCGGTVYANELDQIEKQLSRRRDSAVPFSKRADQSARFATP
jgi:hypothetical protein